MGLPSQGKFRSLEVKKIKTGIRKLHVRSRPKNIRHHYEGKEPTPTKPSSFTHSTKVIITNCFALLEKQTRS